MAQSLKPLNRRTGHRLHRYPEKVVQFGGGNFLRGFLDWIIEVLNEETDFAAGVVIIKPTPNGSYDTFDQQDGLFHVQLHDVQNGKRITERKLISCVQRTINPYLNFASFLMLATQPEVRFIVSNTTETGLDFQPDNFLKDTPPASYPAKLTRFLYQRYQHFHGAKDKGCIILPCELLEDNGDILRSVLFKYADAWDLETAFKEWLQSANQFCNTLVDRIVPGMPKSGRNLICAELGYDDLLVIEAEKYHSWVIESPISLLEELPVNKTRLNVRIVSDVEPYRRTKVRILNGAHTAMMPIGYMLALHSVQDVLEHTELSIFIHNLIYKEIIPSFGHSEIQLEQFANDVLHRFQNPFLQHKLTSIALKSITKFKIRLIPSLIDYVDQYHTLPRRIVFTFAALIRFYKGEWLDIPIPLDDDLDLIEWFRTQWQTSEDSHRLVSNVLSNSGLWGRDLTTIDGLVDMLTAFLLVINEGNVLAALYQVEDY